METSYPAARSVVGIWHGPLPVLAGGNAGVDGVHKAAIITAAARPRNSSAKVFDHGDIGG